MNESITNRNEKKVLTALENFFEESEHIELYHQLTRKDLQDIYALTLNQLPARYAHSSTIIVNDPVNSAKISDTIASVVQTIINNPKI